MLLAHILCYKRIRILIHFLNVISASAVDVVPISCQEGPPTLRHNRRCHTTFTIVFGYNGQLLRELTHKYIEPCTVGVWLLQDTSAIKVIKSSQPLNSEVHFLNLNLKSQSIDKLLRQKLLEELMAHNQTSHVNVHFIFGVKDFSETQQTVEIGNKLLRFVELLECIRKLPQAQKNRVYIYIYFSGLLKSVTNKKFSPEAFQKPVSFKSQTSYSDYVIGSNSSRQCYLNYNYSNYYNVFLKTLQMYSNLYINLHNLQINYVFLYIVSM